MVEDRIVHYRCVVCANKCKARTGTWRHLEKLCAACYGLLTTGNKPRY